MEYECNKVYYKTIEYCGQIIHLWLNISKCTLKSIIKYEILAATPYQSKYNVLPSVTNKSPSHLHEGNVGGNNPCWFVKRDGTRIYSENTYKQSVKNLPPIQLSKCTHIDTCSTWYTAEHRDQFVVPPTFFKELLSTDPKYKYGYSIQPFSAKQNQIQFERLDAYWLVDIITNCN